MVKTYKNAIVLPVRGSENKPLFPNAKGGVFDAKQQPIKDAFLRREYRQNVALKDSRWDRSTGQTIKLHRLILPDTIPGQRKKLKGRFIFAGYLFPHYGHFMLESLAALWYFKQHPETPIIWLGVHNQAELNAVNQQFLDLYDIQNPIHILTEPTDVEELVVPEPGYLIHTRYTEAQADALKLVDAPEPVAGKKIWLSRSNIGKGSALNEKVLERVLEKAGWIIYHPEDHPIRDQLDMLKDAEVVAGIEGSAFHTFTLIPDFKGEIHLFARRQRVEFDFVFIAETLCHDQQVHAVPSRLWSHDLPHWQANLLWLRITPILDILGVERANDTPSQPAGNLGLVADRVAAAFALSPRVELMASRDTIFAGQSGGRDCFTVSDGLAFDPKKLGGGTDHLDLSADQFATLELLPNQPQLYCFRHHRDAATLIRAFNSSLTQSTERTLWIIEYYADERPVAGTNTVPVAERLTSANDQLVRYIGSFCPTMSLARLKGSNIAIAWKAPKKMHVPDITSLGDLHQSDQFERAPILTLNDIATLYKERTEKLG